MAEPRPVVKNLPAMLAAVGPASVLSCAPGRQSGAFTSARDRRRYLVLLTTLTVVALGATLGVLTWANPLPFGSEGFWRIASMRAQSLVVIALVVVCQAFATVAFHTVTSNRIITPSIMGFESLYRVLNTAAVFFLGAAGVTFFTGVQQFFLLAFLMVLFSALLYGWLLTGRGNDIHVMLLVGIVLGGGLGALTTFMQRMLDPSEFDILTARMFGNISNADPTYLPYVIPIVVISAGALFVLSIPLNVMSLGREQATNLGVNHRLYSMLVLALVSILMAMSTSLVGPMTFLGFLIATLAYQLTDTFDHRLIFPAAVLIGYDILALAYFVLRHIFSAQGAVTVIIELIGGLTFLIFIIRKGRL